jgi:hypothetical protein
MTRIASTAVIYRPPDVVFDYVTTPGNWPDWHPSSLGVTGATDHPLEVGEQCTEHFRVAGRESRYLIPAFLAFSRLLWRFVGVDELDRNPPSRSAPVSLIAGLVPGWQARSSDTQNACGEESAGGLRKQPVKLSSQVGRPTEAGTKHAVALDGIQRYVLENGMWYGR